MQKTVLIKMPSGQIIAVNDYEKVKKRIRSGSIVVGTVDTELTANELNKGIYSQFKKTYHVLLIVADCLKEKNKPKNEIRKRVKKCKNQNQ